MERFEPFYIIKASGEKELFDINKLARSLTSAGASALLINKIIDEIKKGIKFASARDVYRFASKILCKYNKGAAGRYSLKTALRDLGPTGYPFEAFVAQIFRAQGFETKLDQIALGKCISHELDVVVKKDEHQFMVECKFHNSHGIKTDVKVALYIKSRFDDIKQRWLENIAKNGQYHQAWVFTNTKFTINCIDYAQCVGINLVGWSYPKKGNIAQLIDQYELYPITVLRSLNKFQKKLFVEHDIVLCKQICKNPSYLEKLNIGNQKIDLILSEAKAVCSKE